MFVKHFYNTYDKAKSTDDFTCRFIFLIGKAKNLQVKKTVKINQEELDKKLKDSMKAAQQECLEFTRNLPVTVKLKIKRLNEDVKVTASN